MHYQIWLKQSTVTHPAVCHDQVVNQQPVFAACSGLPHDDNHLTSYFTKWKQALRNMEATTVANIPVQEFISHFGVPNTCTQTRVEISDELIKKFDRTLLNMLSTSVDKDQRTGDLQLPQPVYKRQLCGATPFSLMFGRSAQLYTN